MVPTPINTTARSSRLLYTLASLIVHNVPKLVRKVTGVDADAADGPNAHLHSIHKRNTEAHGGKLIAFGILIPVLVLLSGLFAGLTLGYMSLDETQLHVLSISGSPKQKEYARKIQPIRKNGHLLLITLILANMIVNETLPVISDPVLGGGPQSVVVSTVLIVIFSEIIPQSVCTRYGLAIGAQMAWFVRCLIFALGIVSWPVAKLLEIILGPHHGIMYRRAELKELIALHANTGELGGDLKHDTVAIIGATLDLQEKVVRQAMTPIDNVFMLPLDTKLDHDTMQQIYDSGHSRVPVYEEVDVPVVSEAEAGNALTNTEDLPLKTKRARKIVGILLVKQCLMLDPKDATPLRTLHLQKAYCIPNNWPLLEVLDRFQEGRSHMAIVGRFSIEKAASVKREVKQTLTRRLKERVGIHDGSSSSSSSESSSEESDTGDNEKDKDATLRGDRKRRRWNRRRKSKRKTDIETGEADKDQDEKPPAGAEAQPPQPSQPQNKAERAGMQVTWARITSGGREQNLPDDAVLGKENAEEFLQSVDPAVLPLGIITLEDILEELIGEEIYDEFDKQGHSRLKNYEAPSKRKGSRQDSSNASGATPSPAVGSDASATQVTVSSSPMPLSPAVSEATAAGHAPKGVSLGPSLSALVSQKKMRAESTTSRSASRRGKRRSSAPATPSGGDSGPSQPQKEEKDESNDP